MNKLTANSPPIATVQALAADAIICAVFLPVLFHTKDDWWLLPQYLLLAANTAGLFIRMYYAVWRKND
jgi:hypothetical protein